MDGETIYLDGHGARGRVEDGGRLFGAILFSKI